jgi:hypothetical protein
VVGFCGQVCGGSLQIVVKRWFLSGAENAPVFKIFLWKLAAAEMARKGDQSCRRGWVEPYVKVPAAEACFALGMQGVVRIYAFGVETRNSPLRCASGRNDGGGGES